MEKFDNVAYYERTKALQIIDEESDDLLRQYFVLLEKTNGTVCKSCGIRQGEPLKGFPRYYCKHVTGRIDKKLLKQKKNLFDRVKHLMEEKNEIHN